MKLPRVWLALSFAVTASSAAQSVRLNDGLAQPGAGDVFTYEISPTGTHVAYRADQVLDGVSELFAAPLDGSAAPVRLHAPLTGPNKDVTSFSIGAGGLVVYVADLVTDERFELYSAPLGGSASPLVLSGAMVNGGDVTSFQLTSDGTHAVFLADWLVNDRFELFRVPVDGSTGPLRLDPSDRHATGLYRLSPDDTFVVYATSSGGDERLYRVPLDASQPPFWLATSGLPQLERTYFLELELSADGQHAAYVPVDEFLDRGNLLRAGLFGVALDGSVPAAQLHLQITNLVFDPPPSFALAGSRVVHTELDGECYTVATDGTGRVLLGTDVSTFTLSPDGTLVAFLSGTPAASTLFLAPVDGSSPATAMTDPGQLESPRFSPNSLLVLFLATNPSTSFRGLYAVTTTPGPPVLFNAPPVPGRGVLDFEVAPDGQSVVYREDRAADEVFELWSVDVDLTPRKLSGPLGGFRDVLTFRISPDSARVAYLADQNLDQTNELFGAPIDAATPAVQYNDPLPSGPVLGDVLGFRTTSDGARVVYHADQEVDGFADLYATRSDGRGAPVRLTAPLSDSGTITDYFLTPTEERVVFKFFRFPPTLPESLFSCPRSGAGPAVELDSSPDGFATVLADPSGTFVVYRKIAPLSGFQSLHRAELDGSQPPITLVDIPLLNQSVSEFQITGDGLGVLYRANLQDTSETELFREPSDGSGPRIQLNAPLVSGGDVFGFQLSLDSSRVVYLAHQDVFGRFELYSTPSDGSGPVVKLNGTPVVNGDIEEFAFTPDGTRVVYRADQVVNNQHELFAAPLVGGTPALRLTVLSAGRNVEPDFALGADSAAVFYRADALTLAVLELFTVPTDASASPLRLSADLVAGGNVSSFAVSPDQAWVVYLADQNVDEQFELYRVSATGGPALALNETLPATADVTAFRIAPDSQWVFWLADANGTDRFELFRAPLDGSAPPELVNRPLPTGGDVQPDFQPLSGGRVLYRADQETNELFELYSFLNLKGRIRPSGAPTQMRTRGY